MKDGLQDIGPRARGKLAEIIRTVLKRNNINISRTLKICSDKDMRDALWSTEQMSDARFLIGLHRWTLFLEAAFGKEVVIQYYPRAELLWDFDEEYREVMG